MLVKANVKDYVNAKVEYHICLCSVEGLRMVHRWVLWLHEYPGTFQPVFRSRRLSRLLPMEDRSRELQKMEEFRRRRSLRTYKFLSLTNVYHWEVISDRQTLAECFTGQWEKTQISKTETSLQKRRLDEEGQAARGLEQASARMAGETATEYVSRLQTKITGIRHCQWYRHETTVLHNNVEQLYDKYIYPVQKWASDEFFLNQYSGQLKSCRIDCQWKKPQHNNNKKKKNHWKTYKYSPRIYNIYDKKFHKNYIYPIESLVTDGFLSSVIRIRNDKEVAALAASVATGDRLNFPPPPREHPTDNHHECQNRNESTITKKNNRQFARENGVSAKVPETGREQWQGEREFGSVVECSLSDNLLELSCQWFFRRLYKAPETRKIPIAVRPF